MPRNNKEKLQVWVPSKVKEGLKIMAEERGMTLTNLVLHLFLDVLESEQRKGKDAEQI